MTLGALVEGSANSARLFLAKQAPMVIAYAGS